MAKVAVIILNWNGMALTRQCVNALLRSKFTDFDVCILDNGSINNESVELAKKFSDNVSVHRSDVNLGFAGGNNYVESTLLATADYKYYLLLNQDTVIDRNCLTELVQYMDSHPTTAVAGPLVLEPDNATVQSCGANISLRTGKIISRFQAALRQTIEPEPEQVDCIVGNCFMVRKRCVDTIGLFDDTYFAYYEEADWCMRARNQGWFCTVVPQATIAHSKASGFRTYLNVRNMIWFEKKFATIGQLLMFFVYFWLWFVPERIKKGSPIRELWRGAFHGWFGLHKGLNK